jgi:hypothetical protein
MGPHGGNRQDARHGGDVPPAHDSLIRPEGLGVFLVAFPLERVRRAGALENPVSFCKLPYPQ